LTLVEMEQVVPWRELHAVAVPLYGPMSMRQFVGTDRRRERVPDETTILSFLHALERHGLTQALFDRTNAYVA
jgi:hypothetical protein